MKLIPVVTLAVLGVVLAQEPNRPQNFQPGANQPQYRQEFQDQRQNRQPWMNTRNPQPVPKPQPTDFRALKAYLGISDAQLDQMRRAGEQSRRQAEEKSRAIMPQIHEKHQALQKMLATGGDAAAIGKQMLEIQALEKQVHALHTAARDSQVAVLSAEQRAKFKVLEDFALLPAAARDAIQLGLVPAAMQAVPVSNPGQPGPR